MIELSIILGLFVILILSLRSKNNRIKSLQRDKDNLRIGFNIMSTIIKEANIMEVPPKDLEDK